MLSLRQVFVVGTFLSAAVHAQVWDYSAGTGLRSMPFGAAVVAEGGYGHRLWGNQEGYSTEDFLYGYVRPYAKLQSSAVVNKGEAGLDIYPISIFGLTISQSFTHRNTDLSTLDCTILECRGGLNRTVLSSQLLTGYGAYFFVPSVRWEFLNPSTTGRNFGDESSSLEGQDGGDRILGGGAVAGAKLSDTLSTGLYVDAARMHHTKHNNLYAMLFGRQILGPWTATISAGTYRSTTQKTTFTAGVAIGWTGKPTIGLH